MKGGRGRRGKFKHVESNARPSAPTSDLYTHLGDNFVGKTLLTFAACA